LFTQALQQHEPVGAALLPLMAAVAQQPQTNRSQAALGMDRVILETDAATVAKALSDPTTDRSVIGIPMAEIKTQMFFEFSACIISHVPRVCNVVAHTLAAIGLNCREGPLVAGDLAGSGD